MVQDYEEETKSLRKVIDDKNREIMSKIEMISTLEHEISQYKIDYLYSRFGADANGTYDESKSGIIGSLRTSSNEELFKIELVFGIIVIM